MWWKGCFIFASCMIAFQPLQAPNLECGLGTRVVVAVQPRPPPRAFPSLAGSGGPRLWTWTDPCLSMSSMGFCSPGLSCRLTIPYFRCVSWCAFGPCFYELHDMLGHPEPSRKVTERVLTGLSWSSFDGREPYPQSMLFCAGDAKKGY